MADLTTVSLHCSPDDKKRWLNSARVAGQPFAEWAAGALDAASVDTAPAWAEGLSERAVICLLSEGINSRQHLIQLLASGLLNISSLPNAGRKIEAEVMEWLES